MCPLRGQVAGAAQGVVQKRWSGLLTELFTNADNFSLTFGPQLDPLVRTLLLGATFLKQALYELLPDPAVLSTPATDANFASVSAPRAWRQGKYSFS